MQLSRTFLLIMVAVLLAACAPEDAPDEADNDAEQAVEDLHALFDDEWERRLEENPTFAARQGDERYNDRWPDQSAEAIEARREATRDALDRLLAIDREVLPEKEQLNYDLFRYDYENSIAGFEHDSHLIPLNQRGGIQNAHRITDALDFDRAHHYEDWIARLEGFGEYMDQTIALMERGLETGWTLPQIIAERIPPQIESQLVDEPEDSGFYAPFKDMPERIDDDERDALRESGLAAVEDVVLPAYERFHEFFTEKYIPGAKESLGARDFPNGEEYYAHVAASHTTTELTPEEIHEIGLDEVERIRAKMKDIKQELDFDGDLLDFFEYLRTDEKFFFEDPDDLLQYYKAESKRIDPKLPAFFKTMPRMPYGVRPIPDEIAPDTTTAYYSRPSGDGRRAGYYYVNLYRPETRPKWEVPALSVHEAVPGHHFQIALAQELEDVPQFRRHMSPTAFTEGWALYTEYLAHEMDVYRDEYEEMGQLAYEMWRAVRLVLDTGIHMMDWERDEAIEFFEENAPRASHDIRNEVDRYIAWPGQALAYKIGELRIRELRQKAEDELGDDFDIREFHDAVLLQGAVPLEVLEDIIAEWIEEQQ